MARPAVARLLTTSLVLVAGVSVGCDKTSPEEIGPPPVPTTVTSVFPESGPAGSSLDIYIAGTGFQSGAMVTLDGAATNVNVVSSVLISATTPVHSSGTVDVIVTNPGGATARLDAGFTFVSLAIASISPGVGVPGDVVTVTGAGFHPAARISVGGVATIMTASSSAITARAPMHDPGTVDVVVTNPGGQSVTLPGAYTYAAPSAVARRD